MSAAVQRSSSQAQWCGEDVSTTPPRTQHTHSQRPMIPRVRVYLADTCDVITVGRLKPCKADRALCPRYVTRKHCVLVQGFHNGAGGANGQIKREGCNTQHRPSRATPTLSVVQANTKTTALLPQIWKKIVFSFIGICIEIQYIIYRSEITQFTICKWRLIRNLFLNNKAVATKIYDKESIN